MKKTPLLIKICYILFCVNVFLLSFNILFPNATPDNYLNTLLRDIENCELESYKNKDELLKIASIFETLKKAGFSKLKHEISFIDGVYKVDTIFLDSENNFRILSLYFKLEKKGGLFLEVEEVIAANPYCEIGDHRAE